jgi:type I restriction enzyme S subunit
VPDELDGASLTENAAKLIIKDRAFLQKEFLASILSNIDVQTQISQLTVGAGVPKLALERIARIKIPIPTPEVQRQMIEDIKGELEIITTNQRLIVLMEKKIEKALCGI